MGSLKDEKRALGEDPESCEKAEDGLPIKDRNCRTEPEDSHLSSKQDDNLTEAQTNVCIVESSDSTTTSEKQASEGEADNEKQSGFVHERVKIQAEGEKITTPSSVESTITVSFSCDGENNDSSVEDKNMDNSKQKSEDLENILSPVPLTPDPTDPRSPAPFGQQHMRTQVSLEVVQCCSAATSPMTPPEGGHSFFFPNSFGKNVDLRADTKDAELQVGRVEFCSVATSPMTPRSPSTTAFPELVGQETVQRDGSDKNDNVPKVELDITGVSVSTKSKEINPNDSQENKGKVLPTGPDSPAAPEKSPPNTQLRMGSMDQDITILVTHYVNNDEEEKSDSLPESDDENEEVETSTAVKRADGKEMVSTHSPNPSQNSPDSNPQEETHPLESHPQKAPDKSEHSDPKKASDEQRDVSVTKCVIPESPAPFGCQNIRTQVSLEVVQCQSVATSPMTPPEGGQAFYFPSTGQSVTLGTDTRDAELQVGQQVEFRSVATAPMTPRTPVATTFPDIRKESSVEEKIKEEEENEDLNDASVKEEEPSESKEKDLTEEEKQETESDEEKSEEPVQEVSWDEKGMTWEVYGAVVEVAVLGSAIQKHLEKQVKKQKIHPSMPPPPPLNPSAMPLTAEALQGGSGSGKGRASKRGKQDGKVGRRRRNPFRQLMENMQQPHCCSKAHTTE